MVLSKFIAKGLLICFCAVFLQMVGSVEIISGAYAQEQAPQVPQLTKSEQRTLEKAQIKETKRLIKEEKKARKEADKVRKAEAKRLAKEEKKARKAAEKARKEEAKRLADQKKIDEELRRNREAAAVAEKARLKALRDNMPAFSGPKKVVAVSRFENLASFASLEPVSMASGLTDQLTDALMQSGGFVVLERDIISDIMGEQNLVTGGRARQSQSARTGKMIAAQVLIKGAVTEFDPYKSSGGKGLSFGGINLSNSKSSAHIALIIRLIDTTTSEVIASVRSEGTADAKSSGLSFVSGALEANANKSVRTPVDKAIQIAIDRAVILIAHQLKDMPYQGRIVKVTPVSLYISASKRDGTMVGDEFTILSVGEEIIDPFTGEFLGRDTVEIGTVVVTTVKDRYAIGKISDQLQAKPKAGDYIAFYRRRSEGQ